MASMLRVFGAIDSATAQATIVPVRPLSLLYALCFAAVVTAPGAAQEFQASPAQTEDAQHAVDAYIAALEQGDIAAMRELQTAGLNATQSVADEERDIRAVNAALGATIARRFVRTSWYNNPPNSPLPGLYVLRKQIAIVATS